MSFLLNTKKDSGQFWCNFDCHCQFPFYSSYYDEQALSVMVKYHSVVHNDILLFEVSQIAG